MEDTTMPILQKDQLVSIVLTNKTDAEEIGWRIVHKLHSGYHATIEKVDTGWKLSYYVR